MKTTPLIATFALLLAALPLAAQEKSPLPPAALDALRAYDRDASAARERTVRTLQAIIADQTSRGKLDAALAVKEVLTNLPTVTATQNVVAGAGAAPAAAPGAATGTGAPAAPGAAAAGRMTIQANEKLGADLGAVVKGARITIQYVDGKWAFNGVADPAKWTSPDEAQQGTGASVGLFSVEGDEPKVIVSLPAGTKRRAFHFRADKDYPRVVLRIMDTEVSDNHGTATYSVAR